MKFSQVVLGIFASGCAVMAAPFDFQAGADAAQAAADAGKGIGEQIQDQIAASGLTPADCVGSISNLCIEAGFSDDPSQ